MEFGPRLRGEVMRVLVCGGRDYDDWGRMCEVLDGVKMSVLIEGCAAGADTLANRYAREHGIHIEHHPADWNKYGKAAGPIRNRQMLVEGKPDLVIAFPGGRGTANMVEQARNAGVPVQKVAVT